MAYDNVFQVLADTGLQIGNQELQDMKRLQEQEETLAAMQLVGQLEEDASRYLLDKTENYTYDGQLVPATQEYFDSVTSDLTNQIVSKNVKKRVALGAAKLRTDLTVKADTLQVQKHLEKQTTQWNEIEATALADINLNGGDLGTLQKYIARYQDNADGFTENIRANLMPNTLSNLSKAAVMSQVGLIELQVAKREITPAEAMNRMTALQNTIVNNPAVYKMSSDDIFKYNAMLENNKSTYATAYTKQYRENAAEDYKSALGLFANGDITMDQLGTSQAKAYEYATPEEKKAYDEDYQVALLSNDVAFAARQGNIKEAELSLSRYDTVIEYNKNLGNFDLVEKLIAGKEKSQKALIEFDKQMTFHTADFFSKDPIIGSLFDQGLKRDAVNLMAQKGYGKVDVAHFAPLRSMDIELIKNNVARSSNPDDLKAYVLNLRQEYNFPVQALGGVNAWNLVLQQLSREITKTKTGVDDPYTLDELKVLAFRYVDNPIFNSLIADLQEKTDILDSKTKSNITVAVKKKMQGFHQTWMEMDDLAPEDVPSSAILPLAIAAAKGRAARAGDKAANNDQNIYKDLVESQWRVLPGVNGKVSLPSNSYSDITAEALKSSSGTFFMARDLMQKNNVMDETFNFSKTVKLAGLDKEVTAEALRNRSSFKWINGTFRLYMKYQTDTYAPYYIDDDGRRRYFEMSQREFEDAYLKVKARQFVQQAPVPTPYGVF